MFLNRKLPLLLALALCAGPALSHVTLETQQADIGASYKAVLRIGHGCDGQATHTVKVTIPDGFYNAQPMPKPGWTLTTVTGPYVTPYTRHGKQTTEGVTEIIWSGGDLKNEWYDEFVFRGNFGPGLAAEKFFFPTVQVCDTQEQGWTDVSGAPEAETPAPSLRLVAAKAAPHHDHGTAVAGLHSLGDLVLSDAFARATLPNAPVAGGFLNIANNGTEADQLLGAASDVAGVVQIHEMVQDGDVMKMRALNAGLPIPAGQTTVLKPGGYHIMFLQLKQPLVEGTRVDVALTFKNAGTITIPLDIRAPNARGMDGAHAGHGAPARGQ